jgi:hypothetical protein
MDLRDFVDETLKQIIDGVRSAQKYGADCGARVNPKNLMLKGSEGAHLMDRKTEEIAQQIEFDVAVTALEGKQTKGGIGVVVGPVALGSQGKSDASNTTVSRIRFSVPLLLPTS